MKDLWGTSLNVPAGSWEAVLEELSGWLAESTGRNAGLGSDGRSGGHDSRATWLVDDDVVEAQLTEPWQGMSLFTEVVMRRQAQGVLLLMRLRAHSERARAVSEQPPIPNLLQRLHARVGFSDGSIDYSAVAEKVKLEMVVEFINELQSDRRRLPVVVVSPLPRTDEPLLDPDALSQALPFRAHVRVLDDAKVAWAFSQRLGRLLSTFDGGIRVYWPGFSAGDRPGRHRLWTRHQIERMDVVDEVRTEVEDGLLASLPDHQRLVRARAKRTSDAQVSEEESPEGLVLIETVIAERDELSRELKRTQIELSALQSEHAQTGVRTVYDAVMTFAAEDHPNIVLLPEAFRSARQNSYQQPDRVLVALQAISAAADLFASDRLDGGFPNFFQRAEFQYAGSVSFTAATKRMRDYERTYEGEKIMLGPHLKLGTGGQDTCLRIYWWVDEEARKLVIGHVGKHLNGARSG